MCEFNNKMLLKKLTAKELKTPTFSRKQKYNKKNSDNLFFEPSLLKECEFNNEAIKKLIAMTLMD